jgi:hypothetical protein
VIWLLLVCAAWFGAGLFVTREELADVIRTWLGLCPCGCGQPIHKHITIRQGGGC